MNYGKNATKRREHQVDAKSTKIRKKIGVTFGKIVLVCFLVMGFTGLFVGLGVWKGIVDSAPDISKYDVTPTGYQSVVLAADGTETATLVASGANRKYVTLDEIPEDMQHAFVAIEDERFYQHNGIDLQSIARALFTGIKDGGFSQGGSTITQQLIKNNVLTSWTQEGRAMSLEKFQRKIQEQYLAVKLEEQVQDKDWILENYLNTINLGANTLGVQAAANRYFGKDVSELTLSESSVIAGITKYPEAYNPIRFPEKNAERREVVLDAMLRQGYITEEEYEEALEDNVYERIAEHNTMTDENVNSYFVDAVIDDVFDDLVNELGYSESDAYKMIYQGGLTIQSTQDLAIQSILDEEVGNEENYPLVKYSFNLSFSVKRADGTSKVYTHQTMLSYYKEKTGNQDYTINFDSQEEALEAIRAYQDEILEEGDVIVEGSEYIGYTLQPQIAMTIMDQSTGQVVALSGGRGEKEGNRTWNRATDTLRQAGSCFKIVGCYAAALDAGGKTLASVQDDAPFTSGSHTVNNYDFSYRGYTNIRTAITYSINIVTVKTLEDITASLGYQYAEKFGFTTLAGEQDQNLSLALGGLTYGVSNLELTAAYAAIANQGEYNEPSFYSVVYDHEGNVLLDKTEYIDTHEVISEQTAWLLTDAMRDVMTMGTGGSAYFGGMDQAGKSGTSTDYRDSLWVGYTPYYTCGAWGGYDDNSKQRSSQTNYPHRIWAKVMSRIHENLEYKTFPMPAGITSAAVCKKSGLLPVEGVCDLDPRGSQVYTEYFATGTVPTETCDHHVLLNICNETGLIANAFCPVEQVTPTVFIVGGTPGTQDSDYLATEEFLAQSCSHTLIVVPESPENSSEGGSSGSESGSGSETGGGSSESGSTGSTESGSSESTGTGSTGTGNSTGHRPPSGGSSSGGTSGGSSQTTNP